jgi:transposase
MAQMRGKTCTYFIGIDVSKSDLDYAVLHDSQILFHEESSNTPQSISYFIKKLQELPGFSIRKSVFCMEHTGIYCNHLLHTLKSAKANIVIENAIRIKNSSGLLRGKSDKMDSIRIAQYAYQNRERLRTFQNKRPMLAKLSTLFTIRNRLRSAEMALRIPLKEMADFERKGTSRDSFKTCRLSLKAINADTEKLETSMDELIKKDERLRRLFQLITSVPHIGRITAIQMIICTNEFLNITTAKQFACYAGVAPFKMESGLFKGRARVSGLANKKMKSLLHICALSAIHRDVEITAYFDRKIDEGKPKMCILNAIRNKLICRAFACVRQGRLFEQRFVQNAPILVV